jgi:hypothetical protein
MRPYLKTKLTKTKTVVGDELDVGVHMCHQLYRRRREEDWGCDISRRPDLKNKVKQKGLGVWLKWKNISLASMKYRKRTKTLYSVTCIQ